MQNSRMSKSLDHKIASTRRKAPLELPKARLCAQVILAAIDGESAEELALQELKQGLGSNWSGTTAMQFMSGRRGAFAADCAAPSERPRLYLAHLVANAVCSEHGLGGVNPPDNVDFSHFNALVLAARRYAA
jgi:hypothetical protein